MEYQIRRKKEKITGQFQIRPNTSDEKSILEVWKKNSYQRKEFRVEPGERWLDLGSNIGAFSVYAGLRGCDVIAFEADEYNAQATEANITLNRVSGVVVRAAIMHDDYESNTVDFYVNSRPMALRRHSVYQPKKDFVVQSIPAIRFGDLPLDRVDAIKMNIEGAEIDLLERVRDYRGVKKFVFEYSFDKDPSIARFKSILARLRTHFDYVDHNKHVPDAVNWIHYPPNIFVYCKVTSCRT
jgi:FkbM family methyltransferase